MKRLKRFIKPTYGKWLTVTPKKWWSPSARKSARIGAVIFDRSLEEAIGPDPTPMQLLTYCQRMLNDAHAQRIEARR